MALCELHIWHTCLFSLIFLNLDHTFAILCLCDAILDVVLLNLAAMNIDECSNGKLPFLPAHASQSTRSHQVTLPSHAKPPSSVTTSVGPIAVCVALVEQFDPLLEDGVHFPKISKQIAQDLLRALCQS